jgi:hypothetical protein
MTEDRDPEARPSARRPKVAFGSPRQLPRARELAGRVVVLDIAFAATSMGTSFERITGRLITELGDRLAAWVDHHDHELHDRYRSDPRFVLATKAQHGACPEMVTPELVARVGDVDTILCHLDLDGLYAASKWLRGGKEPYDGADADARAIDTRTGSPGPIADLIDRALRAHFRDAPLKHRIVDFLVGGARDTGLRAVIEQAARDYETILASTRELCARFELRGRVALVDARGAQGPIDKTELLLAGQAIAPIAIVRDAGTITIAAGFDSGYDFLALLGLEGGMPTRVSLPESRLEEVLERVNR